MRSVTDEELIQQVRRRDTQALETLYARHSRPAISLAYHITGRMDIAEEVAQDVFLKLWEQPHLFDPARGRFVGWLLRIVHNHSLNVVRRGASHPTISSFVTGSDSHDILATLPDDAPKPEDVVWLKEQSGAVHGALGQLTEPQRVAIELAYFKGMPQREIATHLGVPLGTIKTRIRLGLQKMKQILDAQGMSA